MKVFHESDARKVELPGRTVIPLVGTEGIKSERMSFGVAYLPPLSKMDPHRHINEEEIIFIIEGFGKVHFGDGSVENIEPGSVIVAPNSMEHIMENTSKRTMKWAWVFNPTITIGKHTSK